MTLVAEVAGSLDGWLRQFGYLEETALGVFAWSDMERQVEALVAALAARGIDLELAYQWRRAEAVLTDGWIGPSLNTYGGSRYLGSAIGPAPLEGPCQCCGQARHDKRQSGNGWGDGPVAALSALADALEAQK